MRFYNSRNTKLAAKRRILRCARRGEPFTVAFETIQDYFPDEQFEEFCQKHKLNIKMDRERGRVILDRTGTK